MAAYTGGDLNRLNGKYGISAPAKSVPVMKLIKVHRPKSKEELCELIKRHFESDCYCGVKSQGTVEDFGKNLFNAQILEWGETKFSLTECIQWEYDLFVLQSLKGTLVENKAITELKKILPGFDIEEAEGFIDEELRIDLIISKDKQKLCGIQVKPYTFNMVRESVIEYNKKANQRWDRVVHYLYYDQNEDFINLNEIVTKIKTQ